MVELYPVTFEIFNAAYYAAYAFRMDSHEEWVVMRLYHIGPMYNTMIYKPIRRKNILIAEEEGWSFYSSVDDDPKSVLM